MFHVNIHESSMTHKVRNRLSLFYYIDGNLLSIITLEIEGKFLNFGIVTLIQNMQSNISFKIHMKPTFFKGEEFTLIFKTNVMF